MLKGLKISWREHLKDNLLLYILVLFLLVVGIALGALTVKLLTIEETMELTQYLSAFFGDMEGVNLDYFLVLKESLVNNLKTLTFIWFLGLTVLGVPLIFILLLSKGFILGFTAGFLIQEQGLQGIILSFLTLTLPNFFILPALIIASVLGITFSIWLVKGRREISSFGLGQQLIAYSSAMLFFALLIFIGGALEAYTSSYVIKFVIAIFES